MQTEEPAWKSARIRGQLFIGLFGFLAVSFGSRAAQGDSSPLLVTGVIAIASAALFGPLVWAVRSRLPLEQRERLSSRLTPVILVLVIGGVLAIGLAARSTFEAEFAAAMSGMMLGIMAVMVIELLAVPERLRGPVLR